MHPRALVRPLEPEWQGILDAVLRSRGKPVTGEVARLAPKLAELSQAYNEGRAEGTRTKLPLEARIAFSFVRDAPKGAGAVRELVMAGALTLPSDRPLRVVDVGAGLGAMTWGLARALAASGARGQIDALLVDEDPEALSAAEAIARAAKGVAPLGQIELGIRTRSLRLGTGVAGLPEADVVIVGQVLSELDLGLDAASRASRHAALIGGLLSSLAPGGSLVVIEPALRDRTRHLHAVRDRLLATEAPPTVFAPCLHMAPCPALAVEGEWCHEDLSIDLPGWLVPLARAAGLRYQGLTFSYLVLRRDAISIGLEPAAPSRLRMRLISDLLRTKGKTEVFGCTAEGARVRLRRLDRDEIVGDGWRELQRGDIVTLEADPAPIDDRGRVVPSVAIDVWPSRR